MARKPKASKQIDKGLSLRQEAFACAYLATMDAEHAASVAGLALGNAAPASKYVYFLVSSDRKRILYVGKGTGKRMFHHVRDVVSGRISGLKKHNTLAAFVRSGEMPCAVVFAECPDDKSAITLERVMIARLWNAGLCNGRLGDRTNDDIAIAQIDHPLCNVEPYCKWVSRSERDPRDVALYWDIIGELSKMKRDPQSRLQELSWSERV